MRLLLDTHIYLWAVTHHPRFTPELRRTLTEAQEVYVSSASIWEMSIKIGLGKLEADIQRLIEVIEPSGFIPLPVWPAPAGMVAALPMIHRDPFDRLLIAQALHKGLTFVTADALISQYPIQTLTP
jgi:PIN domain nuclease of toxin-antitoxin system